MTIDRREHETTDTEEGGKKLQLVVSEHLLTTFPPGHAFLLSLTGLSSGQFLLLVDLNLVTHGIVLILLLSRLLVDSWSGSLALNPVVSGGFEITILHGPNFLANRLGELPVVCDDEDTTFEGLQSLDKGGKRFTVEVV